MIAEQRLKRRILEGMAEDNIEVIHNQPRGTIRRKRQARLQRLRRAVVAGGSLLVIATVVLALSIRSDASSNRGDSETTNTSLRSLTVAPPLRAEAVSGVNDLTDVINGSQAHAIQPAVIPLAVRTLAIDAGHGGTDSGALLPRYGMLEKDLAWDIANRLRQLAERHEFEVVMTRPSDETVPLRKRTEISNSSNADLFVSIHVNLIPYLEDMGIEN